MRSLPSRQWCASGRRPLPLSCRAASSVCARGGPADSRHGHRRSWNRRVPLERPAVCAVRPVCLSIPVSPVDQNRTRSRPRQHPLFRRRRRGRPPRLHRRAAVPELPRQTSSTSTPVHDRRRHQLALFPSVTASSTSATGAPRRLRRKLRPRGAVRRQRVRRPQLCSSGRVR